MRFAKVLSLVCAALSLVACGGSPAPEPATVAQPAGADDRPEASPTSPDREGAAEQEARSLPASCEGSSPCTMPKDFGGRLCQGAAAEVAMHLFAPGSPWQRVYVKRAFKAWHVGGRGEMRDLKSGEEVLVVKQGGNSGSMDLGGRAFDVLRWDGTCVSLMEDEISFQRPPSAVPANITFAKLAPEFQEYLAADKPVGSLLSNQKRLCEDKKAEKEPGKTKCELARRQLSQGIARVVASGKPLPALAYVP